MNYYWIAALSLGDQRIVITGPYKKRNQAEVQAIKLRTEYEIHELPTRNRNKARELIYG